jgi:hypothetical protein
MTSRYFYTCGAAIAAGVMMSIAPHDRAAADDCPAPQPVSFALAAKGSSTNVDYKKAFLDANTALDADFLTQKLALQKASACPEKCSWGDFYPDPLNSPRNYTVKPSGRVKATEYHDAYTVDATISTKLSRTCYKTQAKQKADVEARAAEQKRKKTTRRPRQKKPEADKVA